MRFTVIAVTDNEGRLLEPEWLERAQAVHRQLRPDLPPDYAQQMRRLFDAGARMAAAVEAEQVLGVAVWRLQLKTATPRDFYVDDLVTDASRRSAGVGATLLAWLEQQARALGCSSFSLDSGTQRREAHKFYFREGLLITSFHFVKPLRPL